MGNTIGTQRVEDLRSYLLDSPDIVVHSLLATYKLFKVFHCAHEGFKHGGVVVKLFIPNETELEEIGQDAFRAETVLKPYRDATFLVQCRFSGLVHPNVIPYESAEMLDRSAILVRQFFGRNLFDRMYSQPRLTGIHQLWFSLQILCAVAQLHSVGLVHGDIKSENIFVIGSFQAVLTDLSTFIKPVYLPLNDPVAATSLFFESGVKRRRCFIAPERFIESLTSRVLDEHGRRMTFFDKEFTTDFVRMDLFSAGLTIAELYLEGQHVIDLPELLSYRSGSFDLSAILNRIPDPKVRDLVARMTDRDPAKRPSSAIECIEELIAGSGFSGFVDLFLPLLAVTGHPVYANADMRMALFQHNWDHIFEILLGEEPCPSVAAFDMFTQLEIFDHSNQSSLVTRGITASVTPLHQWSQKTNSECIFPHPSLSASTCRQFAKRLFAYWSEGAGVHQRSHGDSWRENSSHRINEIYNSLFSESGDDAIKITGNGNKQLVPILASLLGSTAMACSWSKSKHVYLDMVSGLAPHADDECIADYMIPYVHDLILQTVDTSVKVRAMETLALLVKRTTKAETGLFSEYLFPICLVVDNPATVRLTAALAREAIRLSQPDEGGRKLAAIRLFVHRVVEVAFKKPDTAWVVHLMQSWAILELLDSDRVDEMISGRLPELALSWEVDVRKQFCMYAHSLSPFLHRKTVEGVLIPLLLQLLSDEDLVVVAAAVRALPTLTAHVPITTTAHIVSKLVPLMHHPVLWIRVLVEDAIVHGIGNQVTAVDQFVFMRNSLPNGCRTLLDLSSSGRANPVIAPLPLRALDILASDESAWAISLVADDDRSGMAALKPYVRTASRRSESSLVEREKSSASDFYIGNHSHLSVHIVNPNYTTPRRPLAVAGQENGECQLAIANAKDWRYTTTCNPRPLSDLGCLSAPDGSLTSLYTSVGGSGSLQRRALAAMPCVAPQQAPIPWKPESLLLATLNHFCLSGLAVPVVSLDATDDGRVIIGAGADCTVRVWRTSALETESVVQTSRSFKVQDASRLFKMMTLRNSKSIVVSNDKRILAYRVDAAGDRMSRPVVQSEDHAFGHVVAMDCFDTDLSSSVVAACEKNRIVSWDLRISKLTWDLSLEVSRFPLVSGLIVSKDATAFTVSSVTGEVAVFDIRFLRPVSVYSLTTGPIAALAHSAEPHSVWISAGTDIGLFDMQCGGDAKQLVSVNNTGQIPTSMPSLAQSAPKLPDWASVSRYIKSESNAKCMIEFQGIGPNRWSLLSGHNDGVVRYWNAADSGGVAYPAQPEQTPIDVFDNIMIQRTFKDCETGDEIDTVAGPPCSVTEGHRDAITDICVASLQYDVVASAGRDGLIKLWK